MRAYDRSFGEVPWLSRDELRPRDDIGPLTAAPRETDLCRGIIPHGATRGTTQDRHTPRDTEAQWHT